ncbi:BnaC04g24410D [Brassica napus]|uniref:BnaC04g24410D protein n=1 Tax=Brassica napus TaxID=3708 RepID=A0A078H2A2_BRANA|nr:BnaC04g24410D [Brassica napus]
MRSGCCVSGRRGDELMSVDMLLLDTNITAVKSSVSDPPADNNHLMATIKLENLRPFERSLFYKLVSTDTVLQSAAPLLKASAKVENLTISELNEFVITAPSQDIDFMCSRKVTGIRMDKGWCYVVCSKCTKNGNAQTQHSHVCTATIQMLLVPSGIYRVELGIADDTAEGVFVCFDGLHYISQSRPPRVSSTQAILI